MLTYFKFNVHKSLCCRRERFMTVQRALRKWWVSGERERVRARQRGRALLPHLTMLVLSTGETTSSSSPQETSGSDSFEPSSTCTGKIYLHTFSFFWYHSSIFSPLLSSFFIFLFVALLSSSAHRSHLLCLLSYFLLYCFSSFSVSPSL